MPRYGFNFQWMFSWQAGRQPAAPDLKALDFMADLGFDFVRIPTDYRFWTKDFDYLHPDEAVLCWRRHFLQRWTQPRDGPCAVDPRFQRWLW